MIQPPQRLDVPTPVLFGCTRTEIGVILALVIGYFIFDEVPTGTMLIGAGSVIAAGVLIIWRERVLGLPKEPKPEKPAAN